MDRGQVWQALVDAIRQETDNPDAIVSPRTTADEIPGWDSLAHVRIVMNLEARTGTEIEISDTYKAATVDDLFRIVLQRLPDQG